MCIGYKNMCIGYKNMCIGYKNMCIGYKNMCIAYKNIVGSREKCSYNRYILITDTFLLRMDRNGSQAMVLIADMFL